MYESIKGLLIDKTPTKAIIEANGVGYRLMIPLSTYTHLPSLDKPVQLFISHVVREDSHTLYGFLHQEDRDWFELLITISGVGPKTAIGIIGHMDLNAFQTAIGSSNIQLLSKLPGIGKKTAERLVIEMRDKFKGGKKGAKAITFNAVDTISSDAINALINLGYHPLEAQKAVDGVRKANQEESDLGKIITSALQKI